MNYFDELLESYNKLKKRTFKLVYLNEDEEAARDHAEALVKDMLSKPGQTQVGNHLAEVLPGNQVGDLQVKREKESLDTSGTEPDEPNTDNFAFVINWGGWGKSATLFYNTPDDFQQGYETQYNKLVNAFMDSDTSKEYESSLELSDPKLASRSGTKYDLPEIDEVVDSTYIALNRIMQEMADSVKGKKQFEIQRIYPAVKKGGSQFVKYAKNPDDLTAKEGTLSLITNFIEGEEGLGKIFDGDKLLVGEGDAGNKLVYDVNPSLVYETLLAFEKVASFAASPNESQENCDTLKGLFSTVRGVGGGKKRTLVKLGGTSEGLILPMTGFIPTEISKRLSDYCPEAQESVSLGSISTNAMNAKKGTMHESLTKLLFLLHKARTSKEDTKSIQKDLQQTLEGNKEVVSHLMLAMKDTDGWKTVDDTVSEELVKFEHSLFNNKKDSDLNKFLKKYYVSQLSLFDKINADTMVHSGLTSLSGDRKDNVFVFKDKKTAEESARNLGMSIVETTKSKLIKGASSSATSKRTLDSYPDTLYTIGLGQKLYQELHGSKSGEFNNLNRVNEAAMGNLTDDASVDSGFMDAIETRFPSTNKVQSTFKRLNKQKKLVRNLLTKETTTVGKDGKVTKTDPVSSAKSVVNSLKSSLSYDELINEKIQDIDTNTQYGRAVLAEKIERFNQVSTLDSMLKSKGPDVKTAKTMLLRLAFACGGNTEDIMQSVYTQDDNKVHTYSHNYVFNQIGKDMKNVNISRSGSGFNITYKGLEMRLNLEATGSSKSVNKNTRTWLEMRKSAVTKASEAFQKGHTVSENIEEELKALFDIQNKLLGKLLG